MTTKPIHETEQLDEESIRKLEEDVKRIYVPFSREESVPSRTRPPPARRHGG